MSKRKELPEGWVWVKNKQNNEIMPLYEPAYPGLRVYLLNDFEVLEDFNVEVVVEESKVDGTKVEVEVVIPEPTDFEPAKAIPTNFNELKKDLRAMGVHMPRSAKKPDLQKLWRDNQ